MKISCKIEGHNSEEIIAFCIDPFCRNKNKFVCYECLFNEHSKHNIKKIKPIFKNLEDLIIKDNLLDSKNQQEEEFDKIKILINSESEKLENHINNLIKESFDSIYKNIKEKISKIEKQNISYNDWLAFINNDNDKLTIETKEKVSTYINENIESDMIGNGKIYNNYSIKEKYLDAFNIFSKNFKRYCEFLKETFTENLKKNKIHIDINKDEYKEEDEINNNNKNKNLLMQHPKIIETYIIENNESESDGSFISNINSVNSPNKPSGLVELKNFLDENFYFQWIEKTYSNLPFVYAFQKNKTSLLKINEDTNLYLCRSANKFSYEEHIRIEFFCNFTKGGKMEIGIGKDESGNQNTLKCNDNICITTDGIYKGSKLINHSYIENNDLITFDIFVKNSGLSNIPNLIDSNYLLRITKNNIQSIELDINKEDYYLFGGFNKFGNSIQVKEFKMISSNI